MTIRTCLTVVFSLLIASLELIGISRAAESASHTIDVNGQEREYRLFVPDGMAGKRLPAFILLHGGYSKASRMELYSGFTTFAASKDIVAVYPDGIKGHWNDGRVEGQQSVADDVSFLRKLIQTLDAQGTIDPHKIYVAGISNGGMMAIHLACTIPDAIAGIAVIAASQPADATCSSPRPIPAIFFHGTADHIVPIGGGPVGSKGTHGSVRSNADTVSFWQKENGCGPTASSEAVGQSSTDGLRVTVEQFACPPGHGLESVIIEGGGHTWPGAHQNVLATRLLGPVTDAIDANEMMWKFFRAQTATSGTASK